MKRTLIKFTVVKLLVVFATTFTVAQTSTPPLTGNGTSGNPYQIATLDNLYWITQNSSEWGKYFIQTADIDASATSGWNAGAGFNPIGSKSIKFTGNYNGQGHIIERLTINTTSIDKGFISYSSGATIENLGLVDASISGSDNVGAIVGNAILSTTVNNCYSTGTITGTSTAIGGLVGNCDGSMVTNSYSWADVNTSGTSAGGLIGEAANSAVITNCYSTGSVSATTPGGLVGLSSITATDSYWDTEASGVPTSATGTAKTTVQMQTSSTFTDAGWDFVGESTNGNNDYWNINSNANNGYPYLDWQDFSMKLVFDITASDEIQLPLYGTVDCTVDWGDGTSTEAFATAGLKSHIYSTTGTYTVSIEGSLTEFGNLWTEWTGVDKLTEVKSLDGLGLTTLECAFQNADNLTSVPAFLPSTITSLLGTFYGIDQASITNLDAWDVSSVTETRYLFNHATNFNQDIGNWNVSSVTDMYNMFSYAAAFNQDISSWDVSAVENMQGMFYHADAFNQPIGTWDVSSVTTMSQMFSFAAAFNGNISAWDITSVTNMGSMFYQATSFNQPIGSWDMSNITTVTSMLSYASAFNQDLSGWTLSSATNLSYLFYGASSFDQDISSWDVSSVTNMKYMFYNASSFNQDISGWSTGSVGDMSMMFSNAVAFDQPIGSWDVGNVYTMQNMFSNATAFNQDLSSWDVSGVTNMENMFSSATAFNGDISTWNTSLVTDMDYMFNGASAFNQNIDQKIINEGLPEEYTAWNVGNVTSMSQIFQNATNFNQPLGNWNVTGLTSTAQMFKYASSFNQPIGDWDVSSIENMYSMFYGATAFDQSLADWDITGVTNMTQMFYDGSGLSYQNYDATLNSWAGQAIANTPTFYAGESYYTSNASAARTTLTDTYGWTIYDLGEIIPPMELVFTTTGASQEIQLPLFGTVNCTVNWGDGSDPEAVSSEGLVSHIYSSANTYTVQISGQLTQFGNGQTGWTGVEHLTAVNDFGDIGIVNLTGAFRAANNLTSVSAILPSGVVDISYMFQNNSTFNLNINSWDVSSATTMRGMFYEASSFNQPLNTWDVSSVTDMLSMFYNASAFNQDIGNWNTGAVTNMGFMFYGTPFNQNISTWDVSNVTSMTYMFAGASDFNQPIGTWNTSAVTNMTHMFMNASAFNQNIDQQIINAGQPEEYIAWDISSVTDMLLMFSGATAFNQPLNNWNTSAVTRMQTMFSGASSFNQDISGWNTANVESMSFMFMNASAFDQNLGSWDVTSCIAFNDMFSGVTLSVENYDSLLIGWAAQTVQASQGFNAGNSMYSSAGLAARNTLTGTPNNWTISDGGQYFYPMELVFTTTDPSTEIQLPLYGTVSCTVDWGDGSSTENFTTTGAKSHIYADAGTYTVTISGTLTQFGNGLTSWTGAHYITKVNNFGEIGLTSLTGAFNNAISLTEVAQLPSTVTDLSEAFMFILQTSITNLDTWDVSNVTDMKNMFKKSRFFNQDISSWNVGNVTNMIGMFDMSDGVNNTGAFNQNIGGWNVSSVTSMYGMFMYSTSFNQDISGWEVGSVTNMNRMFLGAESFNQNIGGWDITAVTDMGVMFYYITLPPDTYDAILNGWAAQTVQNGVAFHAGNSQYSAAGAPGRTTLTDTYGWTITDGGLNETTWDGSAWTNGSPGANTNVTLEGDYTTSGAMECNNMTITAGANITADHAITINGDLVLQSDATGSASILGNSNLTVTGTTTVQNYMEDYGAKALFWHYIAIPVDVSGGSVSSNVFGTPYNNAGTDYYALYYDETIPDYVGITDNTTILSEQMRGYAVPKSSAETLEFTGNLVDGTQSVSLSRDNTGYNLVGNPYPSGLNLGNIDAGLSGITPSNLATTVWIRENGGFNEYNWQSGATVSGTFAGVLPPMQAAWFRVTEGQASGSIQFENTARVHNNEIIYKATENNLLRFSLNDGTNVDNAAIGLYNNATMGIDNYDSEKMFDDNESIAQVFMHINNKDMAINGLPANQEELNIPIGIKTESAGNYKLSFNNISEFDIMYDVYLKDILTGEITDLRKNHEVDFYTDAINANSRLSVIITKSTTDISEINNEVNMYYSNNSIVFESAINTNAVVSVYDVSGKTVQTEKFNIVAGSNQIEFNQPDGIYLVNIRSDQMNQTQKIIIR